MTLRSTKCLLCTLLLLAGAVGAQDTPAKTARDSCEFEVLLKARSFDGARTMAAARWRITGQTDRLVGRLAAAGDEGTLLEVLESTPRLVLALAPCFHDRGVSQLTAWRVAATLGQKAGHVGPELRRSVTSLHADHPYGAQAGLALLEVVGDASLLLRVTGRVLEQDLREGISLVYRLGPSALPVLDRLLQLLSASGDRMRRHGARALARVGPCGDRKTVPFLEAQVGDGGVLTSAIRSLRILAKNGSRPAAAALVRVAGGDDPKAQVAAERALEQLRHERE